MLIGRYWVLILFAMTLAWPVLADNPVPANLPKPSDKEPAKDQPVKVYIQSGQSNSLGFGAREGGSAPYNSIYLSADPRLKPHNMRIIPAAMLPFKIYQAANGKAEGAKATVFPGRYDSDSEERAKPIKTVNVKLGNMTEDVPSTKGEHFVVIDGFLEVPLDGQYRIHAGTGNSAFAIVDVDGKQAYRKLLNEKKAEIDPVELKKNKRYPLRVTYFKGGKMAMWMQLINLPVKGTLKALTEQGKFQTFVDDEGNWTVRNDVVLNNAYMGKGRSVALSPANLGRFGPELGFGYVMGTFHDEPVIILKADIGNRSLAWDCLPPGSKRYEVRIQDPKTGKKETWVYAGYGDGESRWPKSQGEPKKGGWYAGKQYDDYTEAIHRELKALPEKYPQWADQGFEVAGFIWWQGHKDQNLIHASRYEENLVNLIKAWRKEFNAPEAKFVIATIAFGGWELDGPGRMVAEAQLAVSGETGNYPEFKGNVKTIEARDFWREVGESPRNQGYHYNHNAETYFLVGDAMGRAMVELEGGKVQKRPIESRPKKRQSWPKNPTMDQAVQMVFSEEFISPWTRSGAEPTPDEIEAMRVIYQPIMLDGLIPGFVQGAADVPVFRRHGLPLENLLTMQKPERGATGLSSQLDQVIEFYEAAGEDAYTWKPIRNGMKNGKWWYYSFKPKEPFDQKTAVNYRKVTIPKGMNNWYAVNFNPQQHGWKQGNAPFGQNQGKKQPIRSVCDNPQCGCDVTPKTLWKDDVLLLRGTFDVPKLDLENKRYRLVVGGGSHRWGGEGYEVYINGKLFDKQTSGFYKHGGTRGANIFTDTLPEFKSGKITVAIKAFLRRTGHRGKVAPPTGHISIWLEEVNLPPTVIELKQKIERESAEAKKQDQA